MNPEVKQKWVEALRSGRYFRGMSALRLPDKLSGGSVYCCLGVLCDIAVRDNIISEPIFVENQEAYGYGGYQEVSFLPEEVISWADLTCANPPLTDKDGNLVEIDGHNSLAQLNDVGTSFKEIADIIEEYL